MYYQLLSTVVYVEGKFISYFLHSDKKWYKDDGITKIKEVRAYEACNQRKAFFFIYKKYNDIKQLADIPEIVDLIMDSYGKNEDNQVAISLQLDVDMKNRGKSTDSSKNIIKEYENAKCDNLQRFKGFIQNNQLNLHFWRYHNKKDSNHDLMYDSCIDNGTSGFQLDYLLRERNVDTTLVTMDHKDQYMRKDNKKITSSRHSQEFLYYLGVLLTNKNYFPDLKKPTIHKDRGNNVLANTYTSESNWIILRKKCKEAKQIDEETYQKELAYYKILSAKNWLNNRENTGKEYPQYYSDRGIHIPLWWDNNLFNYTSYDHNFSIFFNNEEMKNIPYIKNYYILQYTTICKESKYNYTLEKGNKSIMDQNHGALDGNHYHLLTTHLFDTATNSSLTQYYKNMNYIFKYGEFQYLNYESFNRWGDRIDFTRNYLSSKTKHSFFDKYDSAASILFHDTEMLKGIISISKLMVTMEAEEIQIMKDSDKLLIQNIIEKNNDTTIIPITIPPDVKNTMEPSSNSSSIISTNFEVRKKVVDVVLKNLKKMLQDSNKKNDNNFTRGMELIKKIQNFEKQNNIDKLPPNTKRRLSNDFADLIDLTEQSDILTPSKKSRRKTK